MKPEIQQLVAYLVNEKPEPAELRAWTETWLDAWTPRALERPAPCQCHSCEVLPLLHEQVAQMCEFLGSNRAEVPCDSWHLMGLVVRLKAELEQPTPTGEVTREHREAAVVAMYPTAHHLTWWFHKWVHDGAQFDDGMALRVAQLLATREAAAYQRGRDEAQGGWIAVDERPPEDTFTRLVLAGFRTVAYYEHGSWWRVGSLGKPEELNDVTHWMPLPAPPPPSDPSKGGR